MQLPRVRSGAVGVMAALDLPGVVAGAPARPWPWPAWLARLGWLLGQNGLEANLARAVRQERHTEAKSAKSWRGYAEAALSCTLLGRVQSAGWLGETESGPVVAEKGLSDAGGLL
jgi:hypothetical protein